MTISGDKNMGGGFSAGWTVILRWAALGALLVVAVPEEGNLLALFVPWQAGFAAAMATAFERG